MNSETANFISDEQIAHRAYELWERDGRPDGKATEHWLQAEAMLRKSIPNAATPAATVDSTRPRRTAPAKPASRKRDKKFEMVS